MAVTERQLTAEQAASDETTKAPLRLAILPLQLEGIEDVLQLPKNYRIVSASYDEQARCIKFLVTSDELPEVQEGVWLPSISLWATVEMLPDQSPEYRKVTVEVHQQGY